MNWVLIGNIIALVGSGLMLLGGFIKRRNKVLLVQCAQFAVQGVSNLVLGGMSGVVSNVLSILRNLFCLKWELTIPLACVFIAVQGGVTLWVNTMGWLGWLPVLATAILTFTLRSKDEAVLKLGVIGCQLCWTFFDLAIRNYVSFAFDIGTILSNLWTLLMILRDRKRPKEE